MKSFWNVLFLSPLCFSSSLSDGDNQYFYQTCGVEIHSKIEFSKPIKVGVNAYSLLYPKDAQLGQEKFSLTLVLFSQEALIEMGKTDGELLQYAKSTFFATAEPGKPIERTFSGKKIYGEQLENNIPVPSMVEVFLVPLKKGGKVALGFYSSKQLSPAETEKIKAELSAGLKEK